MILATLFSLGLGYLSYLRWRQRELSQGEPSTQTDQPAPLAKDWLRPKILIRREGVVSAAHLRSNFFASREFSVALLLKLGVLCLFVVVLWIVQEVALPLYFKFALGLLALIFIGVLAKSLGELKVVEPIRSPVLLWLPSLVGYWLLIYFSEQSVFPLWFALLGLVVSTMWLTFKYLFSPFVYLIPAVLGLALYAPWLLNLSPTLLSSLYLFFIFAIGTTILLLRPSAGTAVFLTGALGVYNLNLSWWSSLDLPASVIVVAWLTQLLLLSGLVRQLIFSNRWFSLASLAISLWVLAHFNFLSLLGAWSVSGWLLTFILLALIVFFLLRRNHNQKIIYLILLVGVVLLLLFTRQFFGGFEYVIASLLQISLLLTAVTYLGLPNRIVLPVAGLFSWPLLATLPAVFAPEWQIGLWHLPAITLYTLLFCLLWLGGWFLHRQINSSFPWHNILAAVFGLLAFGVSYLVVSLVVTHLFRADDAFVMLYVTGALLSLAATYYSFKRRLPASIIVLMASTWLLPAALSLASSDLTWWHQTVKSLHPFGVGWVWATGVLIALLLAGANRAIYDPLLSRTVAISSLVVLVYSLYYLYVGTAFYLGSALHLLAYVVLATALVLFLGHLMHRLSFPLTWVTVSWAFLALPVWLVLPQTFITAGWEGGVLTGDSLALLAVIVLLAGQIYWQAKNFPTELRLGTAVGAWRYLLLATVLFLIVGYVWTLLHSVLSIDLAKVSAFVILGSVGLYCFLRGAAPRYYWWRSVGVILISILLLRFFLVEVFTLELVWRSVVALSFATLFLFGAWYEQRRLQARFGKTGISHAIDQ